MKSSCSRPASAGRGFDLLGLDVVGHFAVGESETIGTTYRWLNPVGAADFDADGRNGDRRG